MGQEDEKKPRIPDAIQKQKLFDIIGISEEELKILVEKLASEPKVLNSTENIFDQMPFRETIAAAMAHFDTAYAVGQFRSMLAIMTKRFALTSDSIKMPIAEINRDIINRYARGGKHELSRIGISGSQTDEIVNYLRNGMNHYPFWVHYLYDNIHLNKYFNFYGTVSEEYSDDKFRSYSAFLGSQLKSLSAEMSVRWVGLDGQLERLKETKMPDGYFQLVNKGH